MRDRFFEVSKCDRCHRPLDGGRILSMYNNHDVLCMKCKEAECRRFDYRDAIETDNAEIRKGNFNYRGIDYEKRAMPFSTSPVMTRVEQEIDQLATGESMSKRD